MRLGLAILVFMVAAAEPVLGQTLEGVWKPVEVVVDSGASRGRHATDVQPGLLIFTKRHYSTIFVQGFSPRPQLSDSATNEELGRVFSPFTANAGTYQRGGSTITFTPIVAKVPAVMSGRPFILEIQLRADTLWVTSPPGTSGRSRVTWVRAERP